MSLCRCQKNGPTSSRKPRLYLGDPLGIGLDDLQASSSAEVVWIYKTSSAEGVPRVFIEQFQDTLRQSCWLGISSFWSFLSQRFFFRSLNSLLGECDHKKNIDSTIREPQFEILALPFNYLYIWRRSKNLRICHKTKDYCHLQGSYHHTKSSLYFLV